MTIDEMISVLQAARDGKAIQFSVKNTVEKWHDVTTPGHVPDFARRLYRVKPEPKVLWVNETRGDVLHYAYSSQAAAQGVPMECVRKAVKYVEVVE